MEPDDDRLDSDEELLLSRCRYLCFDRLGLSDGRLFLFPAVVVVVRRTLDDNPCRLADGGDGDGRIDADIDRFRSLLFDGIVAVDDDIISIVSTLNISGQKLCTTKNGSNLEVEKKKHSNRNL